MRILSIVIAGKDGKMRLAATEAAKTAFPAAKTIATPNLDRGLKELKAPGFLAATNPTTGDLARLRASNLPQMFPEPGQITETGLREGKFAILLDENCEIQVMSQIFHAAAFQYELACENSRLRGDLRTVAQRINHDLRTPLGGIITMSDVLKHELTAIAPDRVRLLEGIFRSTEEMGQLIGRICFLLKASAGAPAIGQVRMGDVLMAALQQLESRILQADVTIVQPSSWPEVRGVASWLEVIWWNLLMNALQHGNSERIELGWDKNADRHHFWVADHGQGVPATRRSKLFTPFDSLHEPNARSGLGLSIVARLVELQGGECNYEHNRSGPRFSFSLPLVRGEE